MELYKKTYEYTKKDGSIGYGSNFYIKADNGTFVAIKPAFDNGFIVLKTLAKDLPSK